MDRRITPPKRVTSSTLHRPGVPHLHVNRPKEQIPHTTEKLSKLDYTMNCTRCRELDLKREKMSNTFEK